MKIKNKQFIILKYYIFIIIIQVLLSLIHNKKCNNCEIYTNKCIPIATEPSPSDNCNCSLARPHFGDNSCYLCTKENGFYSIDSNGNCEDKNSCPNKIIIDTNECVGHCPNKTCELGDFCYSNSNLEPYNIELIEGTNFFLNLCKCKYKYNITKIILEKEKYYCFNSEENCPSKYYNSDTKECITDCGSNKIKEIKDGNGNIIEYECRSRCNYNDFYYIENNTCLESCPEKTFVYENFDGTKDCLNECKEENIYETKENSAGNCLFNCSGDNIILYDFLTINNIKKLVKQCIKKEDSQDIYEYNGIYFHNCSYTQNLFNKITFLNIYQNKCIEDCFLDEEGFLNETKCVTECQEPKKYYYKKKCLIDCSTTNHKYDYNMDFNIFNINNEIIDYSEDDKISINTNNFPNPYECLENCPSGTYIDKENKKCYIINCNEGKYINSNLECKTCDIIQNPNNIQPGEGFIVNEIIIIDNRTEIEGTRILEDEEEEKKQQKKYFNITKKYCLSSCPKTSPYYNFKENECYNSTCRDRGKFSAYDNPYICYNSCSLIENDKYNYENNYICYKTSVTCDNYYYITKDKLTQCTTYEKCVELQFKYIKGKECTNICEENDYKIEAILDNEGKVQTIGACLSDKNDCIKEGYIFFNQTDRICRRECDVYKISSDIPIEDEKGDTCFSSCPSNYPYKDLDNKLCLTKCENFFYGYDCYDSCKNDKIEKYYFEGTKKCVDDCKIDNKYYYKIKNNIEKICYYSCPLSHPFVESALSDQREPYLCIENCGDKFYYEDKKVCRDTCDNLYKNENDKICVYQCEPGQKVIKKNNKQYCIDSCPYIAPYISNEQLSETNPLIVEKCTNKCPDLYPVKSNSTKKCLTECTLSESYNYEGVCYEKCPNGTFSDEYNRICYKDKCPTEFKYYETDEDGINICKKECTSGKFYLLEGGECMEKCPEQYKYIGFNKICLKECSGIYGEYKEKKSDIDNYNCLKFCGEIKYTVNDTKECVSECDSEKYYTSSTNKICYEKCVNDKNFPFSTHDGTGHKICAIKCKDSEPNYGEDKVCKNGCGDNLIADYDGACVSECTNLYYKYIDIDNKKCVNECTKFITKDNKCVNQCESPYNYIEGNECKKQCDSNHFSQEIDNTNIFNCLTKCDKDKYYYETGSYYLQKKCLPKCENDKHFVIQDTQICISECPSPYKSYYIDNKDTSISNYQPNLCVLQCPPDKPYSYNDKCLEECPSGNQYHIEDENICIKECPEGSKIDQNTCKSICPEEKKYLDINDKCVSDCPSRYQYYIEGIYKCLPNCGNYYKEENKCVTSCSDEYPYLIVEEKNCSKTCKDNVKNFVVKNFTHNEIDVQRKCLPECPQDYKYIEIYKENETEIKFCIDKCNYEIENTKKCILKCEGNYSFYDYKNGKCFQKCPSQIKFFAYDTVNEYFVCYEKCPSHIPYFNRSNDYKCMERCETKIINITNKECLNECNARSYTDDSGITYCLNECEELGLFQFGDNLCVKDCSNIHGDNLDNLVVNMATKTCQCKNLFYYDNDKTIHCLSDDNCPEDKYRLRLFGTNQCIDNCTYNDSYILSFDEKYCLPSDYYCPINTKKSNYDGDIAKYKCDCSYKYINGAPKICLSEIEECPSTYPFLDGETNECKSECSDENYRIMDDNICLLKENCENKNYWEFDENNQYKCINESDCFFNVENTKQCVKNCSNSKYNIYSYINGKNKCLSSCKSINNTKIKTVHNSGQLSYECVCTDLWYNKSGIIYCNEDDNKKTCEAFNENYTLLIKETKECVDTCKVGYPLKFDKECFKSCEDVKRYYGFDVEENGNECKCKNLWKKVENKTICINNFNLCYEKDYMLLINDTKECVNDCPPGYTIIFNHTCYHDCPDYLDNDDNGSCKCKYKWYKYNDISLNIDNIIICFEKENVDCPKDFYPYLNFDNKQCVEDTSKCTEPSIIFNYSCYGTCPPTTIPTEDSKSCKCNKSEGVWYQFTFEGKKLYKCGLNKCPQDKKYLDNDSQECIFSCGNKYHYQDICYSKCPNNTQLVDEISKECAESFTFNDPKDLESLEENVKNNIKEIYNKSSSGGIVYNLNNSTMQIYGVNKKKSENKDLIMRTNLTYIDLSNCIDALYEKKHLDSDTDLIIVKYDRGDITNSTTINPVEYKVFDSKNGETINLNDVCEDNSIIISYPLSTILNNFLTEKNLRNLEEKKEKLNLRDKFLKGKELNSLDEEIDSFNIDNKLYTDICYKCKINGKDLILEDRFNYLYPLYSFCESNCIYGKTDFILERVYCNCTPRSDFNLERNFELLNIDANVEKVKDNQKGSILKCISDVKNISKNFGFFYGLIIILVEIGLAILTILYSYKVFLMNIKNQFDINGDEKIHNIDTENVENLSGSKKYKNKNEEMIKTSERNLEYPPKKNKKVKINIIDDKEDKKSDTKKKGKDKKKEKEKENDAEVINIKKIKMDKNIYDNQDEKLSYNSYDEKSSALTFKNMEEDNIFDYIKLEKKLLTVDYNNAIQKNKAEILIMILTEILDKIYIIKAIWLLQKYELFSLYFSLYLLWHMLILSFLSLFYNNTILHKIWIDDNYPNLNYHLSFGFLSCIISFVIYRGLYFLINNDKKINEIESIDKERKDEIEQQYKKMMFWAQIKIIIFYAVQLILIVIFFLYLIAFFGIYDGTSSKLVESYGIALIEIIIIKILYGLILGILRKISLVHKIEKLYSIVRFLDLYIA